MKTKVAFTLIEIMITIAIIGIVVGIAMPTWIRQREITRSTVCQENLVKIDGAIHQYALDNRLGEGASINFPTDLVSVTGTGYLRSMPRCPNNGTYSATAVGTEPTCSIGDSVSPFAPHEI